MKSQVSTEKPVEEPGGPNRDGPGTRNLTGPEMEAVYFTGESLSLEG